MALVFASVIAFGSYREVSSGATSFEHRALLAFDKINSAANIVEGVLVSLGVSSAGEPDLNRTAVVAQAVLSDYRFVTAMGRYQQLAAADRSAFESGWQKTTGRGLWQYEVRFGDDVSVLEAKSRQQHLPVLFAAGRQGALRDLGGLDLGAVPSLRRPLGDSLKSDTSSLVGVSGQWTAGGQLWVLGGAADTGGERFGPTGHWVELDLHNMVVADFDWPGSASAAVDLIARSFEFDESAAEPIRLLEETVGRLVDGEFPLPFLKPHRWTGVFDVGGHTLRASFVQIPTVTWQNLVLSVLLAGLGSLLVVSIFVLNMRRRVAVRIQQAQVAKLHRAQQQASVTLASIRDTVITINGDGSIVYANAAAADLLKLEVDSIVNQPVSQVLELTDDRRDREHPDGKPALPDFLASEQTSNQFNLKRPGGERIAVSQTNSPLYDLNGQRSGNVLVLRDVSVERELTAALEHQANHDPLTGIANRLRFEQVMTELFVSDCDNKWGHALCFIDLDQFKLVNDTCGHAAGDELLIDLVAGLRRNVREHDLIARLGGDEFAIVIRNCSAPSSEKVVQRVYGYFQASHFQHSGTVFPVRASIGFVHFKSGETTLEELLLTADAACYAAKRQGRNQVCRHSVTNQVRPAIGQSISLAGVKSAIHTGGFKLLVGEIENVDTDCVLGLEYQVALESSDGHLHQSSEITAVAERHELMPEIDRWVVEQAAVEWSRREKRDQQLLMVGLSAATACDSSAVVEMTSTFARHNIKAESICITIGEDALLKDFTALKTAVEHLHGLGYRVAVACLSASVNSIASLAEIPVDFIKLDLSQNARTSVDTPTRVKLLAAARGVAKALGAEVILENVDPTLERLCGQVGVSWIQRTVSLVQLETGEFHRAA